MFRFIFRLNIQTEPNISKEAMAKPIDNHYQKDFNAKGFLLPKDFHCIAKVKAFIAQRLSLFS